MIENPLLFPHRRKFRALTAMCTAPLLVLLLGVSVSKCLQEVTVPEGNFETDGLDKRARVPQKVRDLNHSWAAIGPDGTLYVDIYSNLIALSGTTGAIRWSLPAVSGGVAINNAGTVFIGGKREPNKILAVDGNNGSVRWEALTENATSPAADPFGPVYSSDRNKVYAFDAETGREKWSTAVGATGWPFGRRNGMVFLAVYGSGRGKILRLDPKTGAKIWERSFNEIGPRPSVGVDGMIYVSSFDRRAKRAQIDAVDGATGKSKLKLDVPFGMDCRAVGPDNTIYLFSDKDNGSSLLQARSPSRRAIQWTFNQPMVSLMECQFGLAGYIYVTGYHWNVSEGMVYALDARTGKIRWEHSFPHYINFSIIGPDGTIYCGCLDAKYHEVVYAMEGDTGKVKWQFKEHVDD